jgi:hypothetical protein
MKRASIVFAGALALTLAGFASAGSALATSGAHFFTTSASVSDSGALVVSWDEAGVGQATVNYTISADGTATYACINGGGNHPKATNKATVNGPVAASGTFPRTKNGRVTGSLSAGPPGPGSFSCPSGQSLVLASVTYDHIVLTDATNGVTVDLGSVSRTFFNV